MLQMNLRLPHTPINPFWPLSHASWYKLFSTQSRYDGTLFMFNLQKRNENCDQKHWNRKIVNEATVWQPQSQPEYMPTSNPIHHSFCCNPSGVRTGIFRHRLVNTMAAAVPVPWVGRSSAMMILTLQEARALAFREKWFRTTCGNLI